MSWMLWYSAFRSGLTVTQNYSGKVTVKGDSSAMHHRLPESDWFLPLYPHTHPPTHPHKHTHTCTRTHVRMHAHTHTRGQLERNTFCCEDSCQCVHYSSCQVLERQSKSALIRNRPKEYEPLFNFKLLWKPYRINVFLLLGSLWHTISSNSFGKPE